MSRIDTTCKSECEAWLTVSLSLMQGMSYTLATSLADRLPKPASDRYSQCIASIQSDARLVAVFAPILTRLCLAEVESQTSAWDITPLIDAWTSLMPDFGKWQSEQHVPSSESARSTWLSRRTAQVRSTCIAILSRLSDVLLRPTNTVSRNPGTSDCRSNLYWRQPTALQRQPTRDL